MRWSHRDRLSKELIAFRPDLLMFSWDYVFIRSELSYMHLNSNLSAEKYN